MSTNPWKKLEGLLPDDPLLVGDVTAQNADGTSTVQLPDNRVIRVRGQSVAVGLKAFVQGGEIRGQAPSLPVVAITV